MKAFNYKRTSDRYPSFTLARGPIQMLDYSLKSLNFLPFSSNNTNGIIWCRRVTVEFVFFPMTTDVRINQEFIDIDQ